MRMKLDIPWLYLPTYSEPISDEKGDENCAAYLGPTVA